MRSTLFNQKVIVLVLLLISSNLFAQRCYFAISCGYAIGIDKQGISHTQNESYYVDSEYNLNNDGKTKNSLLKKSFGEGYNINGTFGYKLKKNMQVELSITYQKSNAFNSVFSDFISRSETSFNSNMIQFKPAFIISGNYPKLNPFIKIGPDFGIGKINVDEVFDVPFSDGSVRYYNTSFTMNGGMAFGFHAGIGLTYKLNSNLSLIGELNTTNLSYSPKKGKFTKYQIDNVEYVNEFPTWLTEFEYVDSFTTDENSTESNPTKILKVTYPFGNIGMNLGLNFAF